MRLSLPHPSLAAGAPAERAVPVAPVAPSVPALWRLLDAPQRLPTLLLLSVLASALYCATMFDPAFLAGTSPFWSDPHGVIPGSWADMATALSGYGYFIRDAWRLPLFQVSGLGAPGGVNIIYTDSTPLVALLGRVVFRMTGRAVNLFGAWTALCFLANGASMTLLADRLGARTLPAALAATAFGLCAPALLLRWGHTTLMAQFEVVLALALYVDVARAGRPLRRWLWSFPLCAAALWTHAYLFAMVAPIVAVALVQPLADGRLRPWPAIAAASALAALLALMLVASGYLSAGPLSAEGFGILSANLLSPAYPDVGVLGALLHLPDVDATGGQDEGRCYLGAGALLLLACTSRPFANRLRSRLRRHPCLALLLLAFAAFAASDQVFLGHLHLLHVPLPGMVLTLAGTFRASGRFVWPAMYLAMALGVAGCATRSRGRPAGALLLLLAASLQLLDTGPLRERMVQAIRVSDPLPIDAAAWEAAIPRHDLVRVLPSHGCLRAGTAPFLRTIMQVQLIAGRFGVPTNSVYVARGDADCAPATQLPAPGELTLVWLSHAAAPPPGATCDTGRGVAICSARLDRAGRRALLPAAPLD